MCPEPFDNIIKSILFTARAHGDTGVDIALAITCFQVHGQLVGNVVAHASVRAYKPDGGSIAIPIAKEETKARTGTKPNINVQLVRMDVFAHLVANQLVEVEIAHHAHRNYDSGRIGARAPEADACSEAHAYVFMYAKLQLVVQLAHQRAVTVSVAPATAVILRIEIRGCTQTDAVVAAAFFKSLCIGTHGDSQQQ